MTQRKFVAIALLFYTICSFAQKEDFQTWISASLNGEIVKTIDFDITPELRLNRNSSSIKSILTDFDLSYPLNKYFRIGTQYRFQNEIDNNEVYYLVNRIGIYGKVDKDIQRFRLAYRAVYEWEYTGYNTREYGKIPLQEMRHKISVGYYKKIWALRPTVSCEYFIPLKPEFIELSHKIRASAGLTYKINKKISLTVDYKYQREFYATDPLTAHIFAANFAYSL